MFFYDLFEVPLLDMLDKPLLCESSIQDIVLDDPFLRNGDQNESLAIFVGEMTIILEQISPVALMHPYVIILHLKRIDPNPHEVNIRYLVL
jgi:hypothetical protein